MCSSQKLSLGDPESRTSKTHLQLIPISGQDIFSVQQILLWLLLQLLLPGADSHAAFAFLRSSSFKVGVRAKSASCLLKHPDSWLWGNTFAATHTPSMWGHAHQPCRDAYAGVVLTVRDEVLPRMAPV